MVNSEYLEFIKAKARPTIEKGFSVSDESINPLLFDWQKDVVKWAIKKGRAALFWQCGMGKSAAQLEWARHITGYTGKPVLILAPLAVSTQTKREGEKFNIRVNIAETAADIVNGINITNYEKLDKFDPSVFAGVVLDESSILKAYTGKVKNSIINAFKDTQYKLSCSATPAPNDLMELLNQAEFLGIMKSSEALACWFIADQTNSGHYRLKGHAEKDFWKWVASWAVCIDKPSDIGYSDELYILPELNETDIVVKTKHGMTSIEDVRNEIVMSATGFHQEKRKTIQERCEKTAELVADTSKQFLVWCYQNDEADVLKKLIPDAVEIRGSDKAEKKEKAAVDFADGKTRVLISKASIFGYGMNFQNCSDMVFCGLDYSFENYYQAVRRVYRFGQTKPVNVYRVIGPNERVILDTIIRKAAQKQHMSQSMAVAMHDFQIEELNGHEFKLNLEEQNANFPNWLRSEV